MADKLSTEEIIKLIRQQDGGGAAPAASEPEAAEPEPVEEAASAPAEEAPAAPQKKKKPAAAPGDTAGIMAAIRSQGSGGAVADDAPAEAPAKPAAAAKKPAAAAPKDTAGILAAIRGGGAGSTAEKPAAAKASPKKKAAAAPAGDLPPVKEMLEQLRAGKKPAAAAESTGEAPQRPVKPEKPVLKVPDKPAKKPAARPSGPPRRAVLIALIATPFALAWTLMSGLAGAWLLLLARFMFPNMIVEPPTTFKIGPPSDYPFGTVSTKWTAARGIWVIHTDRYKGRDLITVMASVCTHLGCTPSWLEGEQKFKCPCHGSGFYISGINFEGPAPRPLERVGVRLAPDGMLEVDKAVKFQEEKGQWEDPKSFVDASLV